MRKEQRAFSVLQGFVDTSRFLKHVATASDLHRDSLGFFPRSVFEEFSRRDELYVLVEPTPDGHEYAGHLLFQRSYPKAKVLQMYVDSKYRRYGLATQLLQALKLSLTKEGFTAIYARVGEDLAEANKFWAAQKFYVQRIERGGRVRGREIVVRCYELETPQLFPRSHIDNENPLGLVARATNDIPLYLIDLNVLFDVGPRRLRHADVAALFRAERSNFCRLAISKEIYDELARTVTTGKTDPMESYALTFPSLPLTNKPASSQLLVKLAKLIFPAKSHDVLSDNEESDLRHVATVIEHKLDGFITSDRAILNAATSLKMEFGIEALSPVAFQSDELAPGAPTSYSTPEDVILNLLAVDEKDEPKIRELLVRLKIPTASIVLSWMPHEKKKKIASRVAVWEGSAIIGYLMWAPPTGAQLVSARIALDEQSPQATYAARIMLMFMLECINDEGKAQQIRLELVSSQSTAREVALGLGFCGTSGQESLLKVTLREIVTADSWVTFRQRLLERVGLKLPDQMPKFRSPDQHIKIHTPDGNQNHVTLDVLETLLSPVTICLPSRPAVITPVQKRFAERLLGSQQMQLLPAGMYSLFQERHYLSDPRTLKHFKKGSLILFYESTKSKGAGAIVAIARVRQSYLKAENVLDLSDFKTSVLDKKSVKKIGKSPVKTVTAFDNIIVLKRQVPLAYLRKIGCGKATDLISTKPISYEQLQRVLSRGNETVTNDEHIIISLEARHARNIFSGVKRVELRRRTMKIAAGTTAWIYVKLPIGSLVGYVKIESVVVSTPASLWRRFGSVSGLTRVEFFDYFGDVSQGTALLIDETELLRKAFSLKALRGITDGFQPPQFFARLTDENPLFERVTELVA